MAFFSIDLILLSFIFILIITLKFISKRRGSSLLDNIPGPKGYPIVGSLFKLSLKNPHVNLAELSKIYGNVFRLSLGSLDWVVLSGHKVITEALCNQTIEFAGRSDFGFMGTMAKKDIFAFLDYSSKFKHHRKVMVHCVNRIISPHNHTHDYLSGLDKVSQQFANNMVQNIGKPYDPIDDIRNVMFSFVSSFAFGQNFNKVDKTILNYLKQDEEIAKLIGRGIVKDFFPFLKRFFGSNPVLENIIDTEIASVEKMYKERLIMNRDEYVECAAVAFREYANKDGESDKTDEKITEFEVIRLLFTLFAAGIDTTMTYISYCIMYSIVYSEHQHNIQQEIDQVMSTKKNKIPFIEDVERMPKLKSFMLETERFSAFIPFLLTRSVTRDTTLQSFFLPKGTIIIPNIYSAHFDSSVWKNPEQFDPSRFISKDGQSVDSNIANNLLLFGAGRRRCPGQYLARMNIAVMLARLFQQCSIEEVPGMKIDPSDTNFNFGLQPKHYKIMVSNRQ